MRTRSSLGLLMLVLSASCVPPLTTAAVPQVGAPVAFATAKPTPLQHLPGLPWSAPIPGGPFALPAAPAALAALPDPGPTPIAARPFVGVAEDQESSARALDCLTAAVYYEARSESVDGQRAVAQVVLNRVSSPVFPASVCGVVYQGATLATGCQFTFTCDGSLLYRRDPEAWERARLVARSALAGDVYAPVGTATYYHSTAVSPYWAPSLTRVTQIGAHIFYRWPGAWGNVGAFRQAYAGVEPLPDTTGGSALAAARGDAESGVTRYALEGGAVSVHRSGVGTLVAMNDAAGGVPGSGAATGSTTAGSLMGSTIAGVQVHHGATNSPTPDGGEADASASGVRIHSGNTGETPVAAVSGAGAE